MTWSRKPCPGVHSQEDAGGSRLFAQEHMAAPILLMANLVMVGTERTVLAKGYNRHLLRAHAQVDQKVLGRLGPFFPEHEVIIVCSTLVTMAGDPEDRLGIVLEPAGIRCERRSPVVI